MNVIARWEGGGIEVIAYRGKDPAQLWVDVDADTDVVRLSPSDGRWWGDHLTCETFGTIDDYESSFLTSTLAGGVRAAMRRMGIEEDDPCYIAWQGEGPSAFREVGG